MTKHCRRFVLGLILVCCLALATGCTSVLDRPVNLFSDNKTTDTVAPAEFVAALAKGRNLERAGKHAEARVVYERLVAAYPEQWEAYHRLGVVADRQRRHREAQALYTQAISLSAGNAQLFNDLGYCFYLQGQLPKAEAALAKAVAIRPASARYRNNLGLVLGHLGRYDEALEQFRRAGSEADAYYNLAFVHASRDDVAKARECFTRALAVEPGYEPARLALASFDRHDQDPDGLLDPNVADADGVRWVAYVEGSEAEASGGIQTTAGDHLNPAGGGVARPTTPSLLSQTRSMVSQRPVPPAE